MNKSIEIMNLTKYYGKYPGIIDLSLSVEEGDIFGFLGPNGAGKSTTIRSMLGLIHYSQGDINILCLNNRTNCKEILMNVGYMPSEAMFYPSMKVKDIIKLCAHTRKINCDLEANALCERLMIDKEKKIEELSLGNRKKVSIVCALQHNPKLCIFDEPTSGLDPLIQAEFFNILLEKNNDGATIFLSSHVLSEVKKYCKNVAIIKDGKLITTSSVDELTKSNSKHIKITKDGTHEDFIFTGHIQDFLNSLHGHNVSDLTIEDPSLEDSFMHFYKD